jgi:hypothetical protein
MLSFILIILSFIINNNGGVNAQGGATAGEQCRPFKQIHSGGKSLCEYVVIVNNIIQQLTLITLFTY